MDMAAGFIFRTTSLEYCHDFHLLVCNKVVESYYLVISNVSLFWPSSMAAMKTLYISSIISITANYYRSLEKQYKKNFDVKYI